MRRSDWVLLLVAFLGRMFVMTLLWSASGSQLLTSWPNGESSHIAANLALGRGFSSPYKDVPLAPTAQQAPLYPAMLAVIFKIFGVYSKASWWVAAAVNSLAGGLTSVAILWVGETYFSRSVGLLAAWWWTLWLYEAVADLFLSPYALSALMVATATWLLPRMRDRRLNYVLFGFGAGLAALLNPVLLTVVVAFMTYRLWSERTLDVMISFALTSIVCMVCLIPWTVRNYFALGAIVPVRDNWGMELWIGNRPGMSGTMDFTKDFPSTDSREYARLGEIGYMKAKQKEALDYIRAYPTDFGIRVGRRFLEFWSKPSPLSWSMVSLMAVLGCAMAIQRQHHIGIFVLVVLLLMPLVYYLTHFAWSTYRHPIEPLMILMASYAAFATGRWLQSSLQSVSISRRILGTPN